MPLKDNYQPGDLFGHADLNAMAGQVNSLADAALKQYRVNDYGADPTGAALSDSAVSAARAAMGTAPGLLVFGVGTYKLSAGLNVANGTHLGVLQGVRGQGAGLTQIKYLGTGACFEFRQSSAIDNPQPSGGCRGINIWGWDNTNNDVYGLRYGDIFRMVVDDVTIEGFGYSGGIGLYADNQIGWSERAWINVAVTQCTECIVFEAKTGPSLMAWGSCSFDYSNYYLSVICQPNQHGVVIRSGLTAGAQCEFVGVTMNIVANCIGATEGNSNSGILFRVGKDDNDVVEFGGALNIFGETSGGPVGHYDIQIGATQYYALARVHSTGIINFMPGNWFRAGNASNNVMSHGGRITNSPSLGHMGRHSGAGTNTTQMSAQADWRLDDDTFTLFGERGNIFTLTPDAGDYGIVLDIGGMGEGRLDRFGVQAIDVWIRQPWSGGSVTISDWFPQPWVGDPPEDPDAGWHFRWSDNVAPTLSTTPGDWDLIRISSHNVFRWTAEHITRRQGVTSIDGASGAVTGVVTLTGTQALTNKTLTAPVLSGTVTGTYTLGGTPTFPSTVVTTTGAQALTNKTISGASNTITNLPASATPDAARLVCKTVIGGLGAEDGANTWAKVATLTVSSNYVASNVVLGVTSSGYATGAVTTDTAIISVSLHSRGVGSSPQVNVSMIGKPELGYYLAADAFKLVAEVPGAALTTADLWVKKSNTYGTVAAFELSRQMYENPNQYVTYHNGAAWQSAVPTGAVESVTAGVTAFGVPVVTTTGTQTLTNKTLTSPRVNQLLDTNGATGLVIHPTSGAVNYPKIYNDATTWVAYGTDGSATDINLQVLSKGAGSVNIYNGGLYNTRFIKGSGTPVNYVFVTSASTGNAPKIHAGGTDANVNLNLAGQGTGVVQANGVPVVTTTGVQDLTNKTLTSPTITNPTITGTPFISRSVATVTSPTALGSTAATDYVTFANLPAATYEDVSTAPGTVALLHCDGANASTTVTDSGVLLSNWAAYGNAQISTAQSKFGGSSLYLDGTGDYVSPTADSSNFAFGTGDFTIEMWIYRSSSATNLTIFDGRPSADGDYPYLYITSGNALGYVTNNTLRIAGGTLSVGAWQHVAVVRSSGTTKIYLDGVQAGGNYTDSTNYLGVSGRPRFGANMFAINGFFGYMDEIRISRYARYTGNFTPPTAPHPDPPAIKLPTAVANTNRYTVCCTGPQPVLLSNGQGQTINSGTTAVIEQDESVDSVSTGAVWRLV